MDVPGQVTDLIGRFARNRDAYRSTSGAASGSCNETQIRREFVGPFLEVLGWDLIERQLLRERSWAGGGGWWKAAQMLAAHLSVCHHRPREFKAL